VRFDGIYVLTARYVSPGSAQRLFQPIVSTYYRYLRFFPDHSVWYLLSAAEPSKAIPWFAETTGEAGEAGELGTSGGGFEPVSASSAGNNSALKHVGHSIAVGQYQRKKSRLKLVLRLRHMLAGLRLKLFSTTEGANNRLELLQLSELSEGLAPVLQFPLPASDFRFHPTTW